MIRLQTDKKGTIIFLLVFVILHSAVASYINLQRKKICRAPLCQKIGASMIQKMDQTIHPCNNFYEFACGNFIKNAVIPKQENTLGWSTNLYNKIEQDIKNSIENKLKNSDPKSFKLLQTFYEACMNEEQIEKTSENEFLEIMKKLGGSPILMGNSWNESNLDWDHMYKFRDLGFPHSYFLDSGMRVHPTDKTKHILFLGKARLGCDPQYLTQGVDQTIVKAYSNFLVNMSAIFGANREEAEQEVAKSLNFEIELAKISSLDNSPSILTIKEMQEKYPFISWTDHFNKILGTSAQVTNDNEVYLSIPYVDQLFKILEERPKRVLANYLFLRLASDHITYLSDRLSQAKTEYTKKVIGDISMPRWQQCIILSRQSFDLLTGSLYVRRHFNKNSKADLIEIIKYIGMNFEKMLTEAEWMDKNTKVAALNKFYSIKALLAYPKELLNNKILDEYYGNLKMYPESFLKSILSIRLFKKRKTLEKFIQPSRVKFSWTDYSDVAAASAFYDASDNAIGIQAGILQEPIFNADYPKYMNYAGIGMILGHELTHGFDNYGSAYDKKGDKVDWWDPKTKQEFLNRKQCIIDQYSNYTIKEVGLKVNGELTQGENIADNGGVKGAYFAYSAYEKKNGPEPRLPGFDYTPKQTFWIAYAQVWCTKYRPESLKHNFNSEEHTPAEYRIIGTVSNSYDFANDFKCPIDSPMNPVKKCSVW